MIGARLKTIDFSGAKSKSPLLVKGIQAVVTIAAREDTKPYVPKVTGDLAGTAETESRPEEGLLVWGNASVPYAAAQYYGLPGKTWPGTVMQWFEVSKGVNQDKWTRMAQEEGERIARS